MRGLFKASEKLLDDLLKAFKGLTRHLKSPATAATGSSSRPLGPYKALEVAFTSLKEPSRALTCLLRLLKCFKAPYEAHEGLSKAHKGPSKAF